MLPKKNAMRAWCTALVLQFASLAAVGCSPFVVPLPEEHRGSGDWLMAGANPHRTSHVMTSPTLPLQEVARFKLSSAPAQNLFVHKGHLLAPTLDGRLFTIDLQNMRVVSKKRLPGGQSGTLVLDGDAMVLAMRYGRETLINYDIVRRSRRWDRDAGDIASEPLMVNKTIYVTAVYEHVDAYDCDEGTRLWQFRTEGQLYASPVLAGDTLVVASSRGKIYALTASTGKELWETAVLQPILATPVVNRGRIYLGTARDQVIALDLAHGREVWRVTIPGRVFHPPAVNDDMVVIGASDGYVRALAQETGVTLWTARAASVISTSPLIAGDCVFFGSLDNQIYCVGAQQGELKWRHELRGRVRSNPILWRDHLIVAAEDRHVYVFAPHQATAAN